MGRQAGVPARPGARFLATLGEKRNRPHVPADVDLALPVLVGCFTRALGALVLSVLMNRFSEPTPPLPGKKDARAARDGSDLTELPSPACWRGVGVRVPSPLEGEGVGMRGDGAHESVLKLQR